VKVSPGEARTRARVTNTAIFRFTITAVLPNTRPGMALPSIRFQLCSFIRAPRPSRCLQSHSALWPPKEIACHFNVSRISEISKSPGDQG